MNRAFKELCARGFTMPQKIGFTVLGVLWVVSPLDLDFIPILGWIDDAMVIAMLKSVWMAPLLPMPSGGASALGARPAPEGRSLRRRDPEAA